jgi:hypothetical protein
MLEASMSSLPSSSAGGTSGYVKAAGKSKGARAKKNDRMSREQFFAKLEPLAEDRLRQVLWELYYKGAESLRQRIETAVMPPAERAAKKAEKASAKFPDGALLLDEVARFADLARSGAYLGGTREVTRSERSGWRFTFRKLIDDAFLVLEPGNVEHGIPAVEQLLELVHETHRYEYFRSEDPVEAMKLVFSDTVERLWRATLAHQGFAAFARRAAPQILRWESIYGWTRSGGGPTAEREKSLADVAAGMLALPDQWIALVDEYLKALDTLVRPPVPPVNSRSRRSKWEHEQEEREYKRELEDRSGRLANWHHLLLERLPNLDAEDRLERLLEHRALGGPEHDFLRACDAHRRGDHDLARQLVAAALERLPGHTGFLEFAEEIRAKLPPRAKEIAARNRCALSSEAEA